MSSTASALAEAGCFLTTSLEGLQQLDVESIAAVADIAVGAHQMGPVEADRGIADGGDPGMELGPQPDGVEIGVDRRPGHAVPDPGAVEPGAGGDAPHVVAPDRLVELDGGLQAAIAGALGRLEAPHAAIAADGEEVGGEQRVARILARQQPFERGVGPEILPDEERAAEDAGRGITALDAGIRIALGAGPQAFATLGILQIGKKRRVLETQQIGAVECELADLVVRLGDAAVQDQRDEVADVESGPDGDLLLRLDRKS